MRRTLIAALTVSLLTSAVATLGQRPAPAFAADTSIDGPSGRDHATIRNEIRRANRASLSCDIQTGPPGTPQATSSVYAYHSCMHELVAEAAQNGTYSEAFALGLDFQLVVMVSIQYTAVYENNSTLIRSETAKILRSLGHDYFDLVNEEATKMHNTPDDICQAAEWKDCRNGVIPMFNGWSSISK